MPIAATASRSRVSQDFRLTSSTARARFSRPSNATSSRGAAGRRLRDHLHLVRLGLFQPPAAVDDRVRAALEAVDIDRITPLEALSLLADLKKHV